MEGRATAWVATSTCRISSSRPNPPTRRWSEPLGVSFRARSSIIARIHCTACFVCRRAAEKRRRRSFAGLTLGPGPARDRPFERLGRVASFAEGFEEARQALFGAAVLGREASVVAFEELGAYKYLLRIAADGGVATQRRRCRRIAEYDWNGVPRCCRRSRNSLGGAGTSARLGGLYIHPNTFASDFVGSANSPASTFAATIG